MFVRDRRDIIKTTTLRKTLTTVTTTATTTTITITTASTMEVSKGDHRSSTLISPSLLSFTSSRVQAHCEQKWQYQQRQYQEEQRQQQQAQDLRIKNEQKERDLYTEGDGDDDDDQIMSDAISPSLSFGDDYSLISIDSASSRTKVQTIERDVYMKDVGEHCSDEGTLLAAPVATIERETTTTEKEKIDDARFLSHDVRTKIICFNPEWPICSYVKSSRRHGDGGQSRSTESSSSSSFMSMMSQIDGWSAYPEIAIDGTNGTGKSTLASGMNREYIKINKLCSRICRGSHYNYNVITSMEYLMLQHQTAAENVIWDRCRYSNIIFYFVHQLMYIYRYATVPNNETEIFMTLNSLMIETNMLQTIAYLEREKQVPTIFLVNSDFLCTALSLQKRGNVNDIYNSKEYNYQALQYFVYMYFAKLLHYPVFDLAACVSKDFTIGDFQQVLRYKIDIECKKPAVIKLPDLDAANLLASSMDLMGDDQLVYAFSRK